MRDYAVSSVPLERNIQPYLLHTALKRSQRICRKVDGVLIERLGIIVRIVA